MPNSYPIAQGYNVSVSAQTSSLGLDGAGNPTFTLGIDPIVGVAILLPPATEGQQIDAVIIGLDALNQGGAVPSRRVLVFSAPASVVTGYAFVKGLSELLAAYSSDNATIDTGRLRLAGRDVPGGFTCRLDYRDTSYALSVAGGYTPVIHFSARPGGGLVIPPDEVAVVIAPRLYGLNGAPVAPTGGGPVISLTVCGGLLGAGQASGASAADPSMPDARARAIPNAGVIAQ